MVNIPFDQLAAASATGAAFTRAYRFDAIITKCFENGPVSRNRDGGIEIGDFHFKRFIVFAHGIDGFEVFEMHTPFRPMA